MNPPTTRTGTTTDDPIITIEHLTVRYDGAVAVRDVSFDVDAGSIVGLIGESGAGKSTLALALVGLGGTPAGSIRIAGVDVVGAEDRTLRALRKQHVGLAFQDAGTSLHPAYTIGEQIAEGIDGKRRRWRRRHESTVESLLDDVGLDSELADRYPHECSGGQKQRVLLAVALAGDPDVLVLDEPTSSLDTITKARVLDTIERLATARSLTVILVTHDLSVVQRCCDRTLVMQDGVVVDRGDTDRLFSNPTHPYTTSLVRARHCRSPAVDGGALSTDETAIIAELDGVTKRYRDGSLGAALLGTETITEAVTEVSLAIRRGECVALVGRSGAGKSTIARLLAGLERPTSGTVRVAGAAVGPVATRRQSHRESIGYVFQSPRASLDPRRTVGESVAEPLRGAGWGRHRRRQRTIDLLDTVDLEGFDDRYPHQLSGGETQRVAVARALALEPELLILDEATSALDSVTTHRLCTLFERVGLRTDRSMLVVTHDLDIARRLADRTVVVADGRIVDEGPTTTILGNPGHAETQALLDATLTTTTTD